ncbi:hypothetical protein ABH916_003455 [Peribacillus frigoritolerans]|uniref:hypothetical protein n=1 Tax=Peribacillus frigoritolerans TaxID=450367 RepID=UPI0038359B5C
MSEDYNIEVLLKFVESQFAESTLDGKFYFSRNRYFIELEENQIDKGIGDKREGVWSKLYNPEKEKMFIVNEDGTEIPLSVTRGVFRQTYDDLKDVPICCFVLLSLKEDFDVNEDEKRLVLKPEIEEKLIEQFAGRDLIFVTDMREIIKRFDTACENEGLNRMRGMVKYYDDESEPHPLSQEEFDKDPARTLLYKRKFFEFQKEYRIALKKPQKSDRILDIGIVRDISYNLGTIELGKSLPIRLRFKEVESAEQ